jgi:hypothetical protein
LSITGSFISIVRRKLFAVAAHHFSLEGGAPKSVLDTKADKIYWAEWSPDGQKLYFTRGRAISNIVLLLKNKQ